MNVGGLAIVVDTGRLERVREDLEWQFYHHFPEVESVKIGQNGQKRPCLIVSLTKKPHEDWAPPMRQYRNAEVLWKIVDQVMAL